LSWTGSKKNLDWSLDQKRQAIDRSCGDISLLRQCEILGLSRSSLYYGGAGIGARDELLLRLIDAQYTKTPYYGSRRIAAQLCREGHCVNRKHIVRLMRFLGLAAIYPQRSTSQPNPAHAVYPYLLRGVRPQRCDQIWSADITYIRLVHGFVYLVAVIDWFSRYVISWELSTSIDGDFCVSALKRALLGGQCEIFNTDQGSQFTSKDFTKPLKDAGIAISMDGRGRALDNVFVERLWRSVKYECVYLYDWSSPVEARAGLSEYFRFYNQERLHQSLGYKTPSEVYRLKQECG
jgi:putative transposase